MPLVVPTADDGSEGGEHPQHAEDQVGRVESVEYCPPDWQATSCGSRRVLGRGESVPKARGEKDAFDADEGVGEAVEEVAVGEGWGGVDDVLVEEDVEDPLCLFCQYGSDR